MDPFREIMNHFEHPRQSDPQEVTRNGKSVVIPAPFAWAADCRATVHRYNYLLQNRIFNITGDVQCKKCKEKFQMSFDLREKVPEILKFVIENRNNMYDRAPTIWLKPTLPNCVHCNQQNCVKPVIADKKRSINWLFLLLGQMLGCCTRKQLKYFCKHTKNHESGAKNRVLYLTYLGLCKQLDHPGPFETGIFWLWGLITDSFHAYHLLYSILVLTLKVCCHLFSYFIHLLCLIYMQMYNLLYIHQKQYVLILIFRWILFSFLLFNYSYLHLHAMILMKACFCYRIDQWIPFID